MSETTARRPSFPLAADFDAFEVFVDLSGSDLQDSQIVDHLRSFRRRSELLAEGRRITLALPGGETACHPGFSVLPGTFGEAFAAALRIAGVARRALLVVRGAWIPGTEAVLALTAYLNADPMIATVQPRFAAAENDRVIGLPGMQSSTEVTLPRAAMPYLPETIISPELPAPLLLISPQAVLAGDAVGHGKFDVTVSRLLINLRRRGFRNLICNRAIVAFPFDPALVYQLPVIAEGGNDHPWWQDMMRARSWLAAMPEREVEAILADSICSDGRVKVLLDCRGMQDFYNGTTHAILGYLDGLTQLDMPALEITVMTSAAAARFHKLDSRYRHFRIQLDRPDDSYLVVVRLDQPWDLRTIIELHEHGLFIVFNMLDTIAWDIIFAAPDGLDQSWRLLPRLADGFLFISNYTRERFIFRFRPDRSIPLVVTHLSLDREEIAPDPVGTTTFEEPYILVFGNAYDHKGLEPTLASLADAFPYTRIVAFGGKSARSPHMTILQPGRMSETELNALMAGAAVIVYPSYYEGFGLPVVHGLAHGRTVVVRNSPLWDEIAAHAKLPGALVPFNNDESSLVEAVGRALHGDRQVGLAFGSALAPGGSASSWRDCARHISELISDLAFAHDAGKWVERQLIFSRLGSVAERA
jgi:glycosyltransferase involved in cell wall biosynthesis